MTLLTKQTILFYALISVVSPFYIPLIIDCPYRHLAVNHFDLAKSSTMLLSYSHRSDLNCEAEPSVAGHS